jgi:hypothetical protein
VHLGFGKFARADRIYALEPIEPGSRGPGSRTRVWVEGIPQPFVASRSEAAIVRDLGPGAAPMPADLAREAFELLGQVVEQVGGVGPIVRREIRAESRLDLDEVERRARALLERASGGGAAGTLF